MRPRLFVLLFIIIIPAALAPALSITLSLLLSPRVDAARRILLQVNLGGADILYLGDSTIRGRSSCESEEAGIDQFLARMTGRDVALAAGAGFSSVRFEGMVSLLRGAARPPRIVVVPVNLRFFSPVWEKSQMPSMREELLDLQLLNGRFDAIPPLLALQYMGTATDTERWRDEELVYHGKSFGTFRAFGEATRNVPLDVECEPNPEQYARGIGAKYVVQYLFELDPASLEALALLATAATLRAMNIAAIFYITPINLEEAERLGGVDVAEAIRAQAAVARDLLGANAIPFLDLSAALPADAFADQGCACEHLRAWGRQFVAAALAERVKALN